tara:strand:- start:798 stop:1112 length:315 start_codon:yes stop_codon:yes gene_type:complete
MEIIKKDNFQERVHNSEKPVILDFYGEMCQPCKQIAPILENLSQKYKKKANFYKIEIMENQEIFAEYGVSSVPTIILFKFGSPVAEITGLKTEEELDKWIQQNI